MLKGNQRFNGKAGLTNGDTEVEYACKNGFKHFYNSQIIESNGKQQNILNSNIIHDNGNSSNSYSVQNPSSLLQVIKEEIVDDGYEQKCTPSIIGNSLGVSNNNNECNNVEKLKSAPRNRLRRNNRNSYHESLQRIGGGDICYNQYQQHWFSSSLELLQLEDKSREERLEITRYELKRHLQQILRSNVGKKNFAPEDAYPNVDPTLSITPSVPQSPQKRPNPGYNKLVSIRDCDTETCKHRALPCSRFCELHIMQDSEQALYSYCTAKFADNRQCTVPVCDTVHEMPLCKEHARKRDNYRLFQEAKPKKIRKNVKPLPVVRPQKRTKKRKRPFRPPDIVNYKARAPLSPIKDHVPPDLSGNMVDHVLALQEPDGLELVTVDQSLVSQTGHLLEETDINTVLSTIQGDEFSDFFTGGRNGDYGPTREETEELERALAAVDNDVKSLEKLSQSHGLLDTFLDEHTLVESLVQIPDMFHNGFAQCGDSIVSQTSRLLSVEPHSHS